MPVKKLKARKLKKLKKMGVTKQDIKKYRMHRNTAKLSKKAKRIYNPKPPKRIKSSKPKNRGRFDPTPNGQEFYEPEYVTGGDFQQQSFNMDEFNKSMQGYFDGLMGAFEEASKAPSVIYSAPTNVGGYTGSIAPKSSLTASGNRLNFGTNALNRDNRTSSGSNLSITGLNI